MYPQRLPIVDSDDGVWGDILRKYLEKEHYNDDTDNAANGGHKNVTIRAGTAGAGGAPLKFTSGTLLTSPEVGAVEFVGDNLYVTQTSGTTRKKVALYDDSSGATGDIYYRNSTGYFTRLAIGIAGQILTVQSGVPSWQTFNVSWSSIANKPAVIAAGATAGEALGAVKQTPVVGGFTSANGQTQGAYARNALYSQPESEWFVPIPYAYNDIAYNGSRGGFVQSILNGTPVGAPGNHFPEMFTPDATHAFINNYSSTSDILAFEITLHRTFYWGYIFGIQQTDWCRGQNVKFEAWNGTSWKTLLDHTNEPTGLTWSQDNAGSAGITKIRVSLTNFNVTGSTGARISQIFLIGFDSSLMSGTFLPRGGGQLYGDLATPGVWTNTIKDVNNNGIGILDFYGLPSAVNYLQVQNNTSGNSPGIYAQGANTDIDINLVPKGTGKVKINGVDLSSDVPDGSITSAKIADGTIMNADVNASAGIAVSKLGTGRVDATVNGTATNTSIWRGTQAQYDAIGSKDSNTIYFITA